MAVPSFTLQASMRWCFGQYSWTFFFQSRSFRKKKKFLAVTSRFCSDQLASFYGWVPLCCKTGRYLTDSVRDFCDLNTFRRNKFSGFR